MERYPAAPPPDLAALRAQCTRLLKEDPGAYTSVLAAARVCQLVCTAVDELIADGAGERGAVADTTIYPACAGREPAAGRDAADADSDLRELAAAADVAEEFLRRIRMLDSYRAVVTMLVDRVAFETENDDLLVHRCLLVWHVVCESYMRALQGRVALGAAPDGRPGARYYKGDVKAAVVRTAMGPIVGHHQILTLNCATCSDTGMPPAKAFISYKENLDWLNDWDTACRPDAGTLTAIHALMTAGSDGHRVPRSPAADDSAWMWRKRNAAGEKASKWVATLDHAAKQYSNSFLLHTGVLCGTSPVVRKVTIAAVCYGSFHFWPIPWPMTVNDYALLVCASTGEMLRGWAIDHDSEAAIGEHSMLNWTCATCAIRASRDLLSVSNARATRADWEMRIAWGPQTYFYLGMRHQGFRRRVDNILEGMPHDRARLRPVPSHRECRPIKAEDRLPVVVTKLVALCGASVPVPDLGWEHLLGLDCWRPVPRICRLCSYTEARAHLFMLAVGCARLAVLLPPPQRNELIRLLDTYGFRLFPAVQVRMLTQCPCLPRWTSDMMSLGYEEAGTSCGQSACPPRRLQSGPPPPAAGTEEHDTCDGRLLCDLLTDQAIIEASHYADRTGQRSWLQLVTRPLTVPHGAVPVS